MDDNRGTEVDAIRAAVANELRARRAFRRMTQAQLIEASGLSKSTIERLEGGKRDMDFPQLIAIARALETEPVKFMQSVQDALNAE